MLKRSICVFLIGILFSINAQDATSVLLHSNEFLKKGVSLEIGQGKTSFELFSDYFLKKNDGKIIAKLYIHDVPIDLNKDIVLLHKNLASFSPNEFTVMHIKKSEFPDNDQQKKLHNELYEQSTSIFNRLSKLEIKKLSFKNISLGTDIIRDITINYIVSGNTSAYAIERYVYDDLSNQGYRFFNPVLNGYDSDNPQLAKLSLLRSSLQFIKTQNEMHFVFTNPPLLLEEKGEEMKFINAHISNPPINVTFKKETDGLFTCTCQFKGNNEEQSSYNIDKEEKSNADYMNWYDWTSQFDILQKTTPQEITAESFKTKEIETTERIYTFFKNCLFLSNYFGDHEYRRWHLEGELVTYTDSNQLASIIELKKQNLRKNITPEPKRTSWFSSRFQKIKNWFQQKAASIFIGGATLAAIVGTVYRSNPALFNTPTRSWFDVWWWHKGSSSVPAQPSASVSSTK